MADPLPNAKARLRKQIRSALADLTPDLRHAASVAAMQRLVNLEEFATGQTVMLYMPLPNEIDVVPAALRCFQLGKTVCVPRVDWQRRDMEPVEVRSLNDDVMDIDAHGVRSPRDGRAVSPALVDLVILPGMGFDTSGNRLGRGGGYYDRFLRRVRPTATLIGVAFDQQIVDAVPTAGHDIAVDLIVTDRRVTRVSPSRTRP